MRFVAGADATIYTWGWSSMISYSCLALPCTYPTTLYAQINDFYAEIMSDYHLIFLDSVASP